MFLARVRNAAPRLSIFSFPLNPVMQASFEEYFQAVTFSSVPFGYCWGGPNRGIRYVFSVVNYKECRSWYLWFSLAFFKINIHFTDIDIGHMKNGMTPMSRRDNCIWPLETQINLFDKLTCIPLKCHAQSQISLKARLWREPNTTVVSKWGHVQEIWARSGLWTKKRCSAQCLNVKSIKNEIS